MQNSLRSFAPNVLVLLLVLGIHPRPLTLSVIRNYLNKKEYKKAILLMKRHRIDLNLIYDDSPEFVSTVDGADLFNLFLSDLRNEDVTKTTYSFACDNASLSSVNVEALTSFDDSLKHTSKVNRVCEALLPALESAQNSSKYLTSVLQTLVKSEPSRLDVALEKLKRLREQENTAAVDAGLRHLLYMVNVDHLFDTALGTYDFQLVIMVAEKSHKDPKEYLPFLNELRQLNSNFMKYRIDLHLRRYEKALKHISTCGSEHLEYCVKLIKDHSLYREAVSLFAPGSLESKTVACLYAEHLYAKKQLNEAGLLYEQAGCLLEALKCYEKALNWRLAFATAFKLNFTKQERESLALALATNLKETNRHAEAAWIVDHYLNNTERCIAICVEGYLWDYAYEKILSSSPHSDSWMSLLKSSASDRCRALVEVSQAYTTDFVKFERRLAVVRVLKQQKFKDSENPDSHVDNCDAYSETGSSIVSTQRGSQYSRNTSLRTKQSRRAERKKQSMKEGSDYEDAGLLKAITEIIVGADQHKEELRSLLLLLVRLGLKENANELQKQFGRLFSLIRKCQKTIWPDVLEPFHIPGPMDDLKALLLTSETTVNSIVKQLSSTSMLNWKVPIDSLLHAPLLKEVNWTLVHLDSD